MAVIATFMRRAIGNEQQALEAALHRIDPDLRLFDGFVRGPSGYLTDAALVKRADEVRALTANYDKTGRVAKAKAKDDEPSGQ